MNIILRIVLCLAAFSSPFVASAQGTDTTVVIIPDSAAAARQAASPADTAGVIDNSHAVEAILRSQNENITTSMREQILVEQIEALRENDVRQRREMQRQLDELRVNDSLRRARQRQYIDSLRLHAVGAPVILKSDTLYHVYTTFGSFTPNDRAKLNAEKLLQAAKLFSLKTDSIAVVQNNSVAEIMFRDMIIASVTETDALWMEKSVDELAADYRDRMTEAIAVYKKNISTLSILKTVGSCLLVVVGLFFSIKGTAYLFRRIVDRRLIAKKEKWFKGIRIKTLEVMNPQRQLRTALFVSRILRYVCYIVLSYFAILLLFGIFPMTQRLAHTLFGWVWEPLSGMMMSTVNYIPKLIKIFVIVFIFRYIVRFCRYVANEISSGKLVIPGFYADWAKATFNIVRIFLYAFMIVLIFPYLPGSGTTSFQGVSVFIGALFTLGSTSVIGNLMAGMVITYMRPFKLGDRIKIGDIIGDVVEKSPFVIRVKTIKNEIVTVPNSTVLSTNVINYSATSENDSGLIINTTVGIGYDVPWRQVNQLLIDAALKTEYIIDTPQPFVLQTALNDFSASYQLCAYTKNPEKQAVIYTNLHQNIQDVFRDAGVEITTLNYFAVRDGNKSTVPAE